MTRMRGNPGSSVVDYSVLYTPLDEEALTDDICIVQDTSNELHTKVSKMIVVIEMVTAIKSERSPTLIRYEHRHKMKTQR